MDLEVGSVLTGKVTGITKFGAFVNIAPGKSGLVHISEISNTYVNEVSEHLSVGQEVNVKVIGIDASGRINLSIKALLPPPPPRQGRDGGSFRRPGAGGGQRPSSRPRQSGEARPSGAVPTAESASGNAAFDDMLKRFMQDSDSKISGLYSEKKSRRRRT